MSVVEQTGEQQTQTQVVSLQQRAVAAINAEPDAVLKKYAAAAAASVTDVTDEDGYEAAELVRKNLKKLRTGIDAKAKAAREDAQEFSKAVIAEAKRLVGIIRPEEERIQGLCSKWEQRKEEERKERERKERERVLAISGRINEIQQTAAKMIGKKSSLMQSARDAIDGIIIDADEFGEFTDEALDAKLAAVEKLDAMIAERKVFEEAVRVAEEAAAEAARLAAEQRREEEAEKTASDKGLANNDRPNGSHADDVPTASVGSVLTEQQAVGKQKTIAMIANKPTDDEIVAVLAQHFGASKSLVVMWLVDMDISLLLEQYNKAGE